MLPLGRCSPRDTDQGNEQSLEVLEIFSCFVHGVLDGFLFPSYHAISLLDFQMVALLPHQASELHQKRG
jgi:hypothetical protein